MKLLKEKTVEKGEKYQRANNQHISKIIALLKKEQQENGFNGTFKE